MDSNTISTLSQISNVGNGYSLSDNIIVLIIYATYFVLYYFNLYYYLFETVIGKIILITTITLLSFYHPLLGYITALALIFINYFVYHIESFQHHPKIQRDEPEDYLVTKESMANVESTNSTIDDDKFDPLHQSPDKVNISEAVRPKPSNRYPIMKTSSGEPSPNVSDKNTFTSTHSSVESL